MEQWSARLPHKQKVGGSNPPSATNFLETVLRGAVNHKQSWVLLPERDWPIGRAPVFQTGYVGSIPTFRSKFNHAVNMAGTLNMLDFS